MDPVLERLHKAHTGLVINSCFFGTLALQLDMKVDPKSKTAFWVDGKTVGVHPELINELPLDELEGVLARATLHAALGHPMRRGGRDVKQWSEACAHVANHEVAAAGMHLPQGSPMDPQFKGMTAEQVYTLLATEPPTQGQGQGQGTPQGGPGTPQNGPGGGHPPAQPPKSAPGAASPAPGGESGGDQGQENGVPEPGTGEVLDTPGDQATVEQVVTGWQEAVAQATQLARAAGNLPGSLERAALNMINPRVSWREAMQRFFKARAKDDYNWMQPNRRYLEAGVYLPSLQSVKMGPVAAFLDLSSSIKQSEIDQFMAELRQIREECQPEYILIVPFDTKVRVDEVVKLTDDFDITTLKFKGGGGTDFRPVVEYLDAENIEPDCAVYLTDLDCNQFPPEPNYPVLWVSTEKVHAPFGEVIRLT